MVFTISPISILRLRGALGDLYALPIHTVTLGAEEVAYKNATFLVLFGVVWQFTIAGQVFAGIQIRSGP